MNMDKGGGSRPGGFDDTLGEGGGIDEVGLEAAARALTSARLQIANGEVRRHVHVIVTIG